MTSSLNMVCDFILTSVIFTSEKLLQVINLDDTQTLWASKGKLLTEWLVTHTGCTLWEVWRIERPRPELDWIGVRRKSWLVTSTSAPLLLTRKNRKKFISTPCVLLIHYSIIYLLTASLLINTKLRLLLLSIIITKAKVRYWEI